MDILRVSSPVIAEDNAPVSLPVFQMFQVVEIPGRSKWNSPSGVIVGVLYISPYEPQRGDRSIGWHYAISRVFGVRCVAEIDPRTPIEHFSEAELVAANG